MKKAPSPRRRWFSVNFRGTRRRDGGSSLLAVKIDDDPAHLASFLKQITETKHEFKRYRRFVPVMSALQSVFLKTERRQSNSA
jgi:hypothetical protein